MNHETCSGHLPQYIRGELDVDLARSVDEHLSTCEQCRLERSGLEVLLAPPEASEGLSELERERLHRALSNVHAVETAAVVSSRRSPWARLAPALGAAALVLVGLFALTQIEFSRSDDADSSGEGGAGGLAAEEAQPAPEADVVRGGPDIASQPRALDAAAETFADVEAEDASGADESRTTAKAGFDSSLAARFDGDAGPFRARDLRRYAAATPPFTDFSTAFTAADADPSRARAYLGALEDAAGSDGPLLGTCGEQVLQEGVAILPVYGSFARYRNEDVLVLGFVYARAGELDRFRVWVWPKGSCDFPILTQDGRIRP